LPDGQSGIVTFWSKRRIW